jgi:hypothetical protein
MTLVVPIRRDRDGFGRVQCPTCEREFKTFDPPELEDQPAPHVETALLNGGFFCPYCAVQAPAASWFPKAEIELVNQFLEEASDPGLGDLNDRLDRGLVSVEAEYVSDDAPEGQLSGSDDMRRVDFTCHPSEPLKVAGDWSGDVHCLICGRVAAESSRQ